jgi:hypothetical protein
LATGGLDSRAAVAAVESTAANSRAADAAGGSEDFDRAAKPAAAESMWMSQFLLLN